MYQLYIYYIASATNNPAVWGRMTSFPNNYNFANGTGNSHTIGFDQTQHIHPEDSGSNYNWEWKDSMVFRENDSARVWFSIDGNPIGLRGDLIADAVKLVGPAGTLIVDNEDPGFSCNGWYDRNFEDMQDEDTVNHSSFSKTPFFISSPVASVIACIWSWGKKANNLRFEISAFS